MKKKNYNILFIVIIVLIVVLVITRGYSYARYASNAVFNYYLSSKGFYFESNDLTFDTKNNADTMWDGGKVYFSITNSSNNSLASEVDISYKVKCEVLDEDTTKKCLINGTLSDTYEATVSAIYGCSDNSDKTQGVCLTNGGEWVSKPSSANLYFEVVDDSDTEMLNAKVKITVTSLKPYKKELSATYNLIKDNSIIGDLSLKYEEGDLKSNIIVTNSYNEDKCVLVSWDANNFVYDNTKNNVLGTLVNQDNDINGIYFKLNKMTSTNFDFYRKDTSVNYNDLYFSLVESNRCE